MLHHLYAAIRIHEATPTAAVISSMTAITVSLRALEADIGGVQKPPAGVKPHRLRIPPLAVSGSARQLDGVVRVPCAARSGILVLKFTAKEK